MQIGNYQFDQALALDISQDIGKAAFIIVVVWGLAKAAKWAFAKLVDNVSFLKKTTSDGESIGEQLGKVVSLLIWLFGLLAILQVFDLGGVMTPVQTLLNGIMGFVPNMLWAGLFFFIGLMVARIVRDLIVTTLKTLEFDKWANRGGVDTMTGNSTISTTIGTIAYAVIAIFFSILALDALDLKSVSEPASGMLRMILEAIPNIVGAALLLALGYLIGRFVAQLLNEVLPGLGFDQAAESSGLLPDDTTASNVIGRVTQIAIVLFFAIAATRMLGFPELTMILDRVLELGGRVVFGSVVILIGFLIANMLSRLIAGNGDGNLAAGVVRWSTMVLFTFMGLQFMGVGEQIVQMAFGALVVGGAVAGALAFGLGGRDWAKRKLDQLDAAASSRKSGKSGK